MKNANRSLIIFRKKDRKPAISSTTHSRVLDADDCDDRLRADSADTPSPNTKLIRQEDLELWFLRQRQFREIDEPITSGSSLWRKGRAGHSHCRAAPGVQRRRKRAFQAHGPMSGFARRAEFACF